jgi:hypothetical protein
VLVGIEAQWFLIVFVLCYQITMVGSSRGHLSKPNNS